MLVALFFLSLALISGCGASSGGAVQDDAPDELTYIDLEKVDDLVMATVRISSDGKLVSRRGFRDVAHFYVWDAETGKLLHKHEASTTGRIPAGQQLESVGYDSADFSPDGVHMVASLSVESSFIAGQRTTHLSGTVDIRNTEDTNYIVLIDARTGKEVRQLATYTWKEDFNKGIREAKHDISVLFSPDGTKIAATIAAPEIWESEYGKSIIKRPKIQILDSQTGRVLRTFEGTIDDRGSVVYKPHAVAFSEDGKKLLTLDDCYHRLIQVWDVDSGRELQQFETPGTITRFRDADISADGTKVVTLFEAGEDSGSIGVWDVQTGRELRKFPPIRRNFDRWGHWVFFLRDGKKILTMEGTPNARIFDAESGEHLLTLEFQGHAVMAGGGTWSVHPSANGRKIVTSAGGGRVWTLPKGVASTIVPQPPPPPPPLPLPPVTAIVSLEDIWRQFVDNQVRADYDVTLNQETRRYDMFLVEGQGGTITNVRYDGRIWSFNANIDDKDVRFALTKIDNNTFEGTVEIETPEGAVKVERNRWVRQVLTPNERAEADRYITQHGRNAMPHYMKVEALKAIEADARPDANTVLTYLKFLKYFTTKDADVNAKNADGTTTLHWAAVLGLDGIVNFLIYKGAEVNAKTNDGDTPLDWAMDGEHRATIEYLRTVGGRDGDYDPMVRTPPPAVPPQMPNLGGSRISLDKTTFTPGETITVTATGITPEMIRASAFVAIYVKDAPHRNYGQYRYPRTADTTLEFTAPRSAGDYEMRLYNRDGNYSDATFVMRVPFSVR